MYGKVTDSVRCLWAASHVVQFLPPKKSIIIYSVRAFLSGPRHIDPRGPAQWIYFKGMLSKFFFAIESVIRGNMRKHQCWNMRNIVIRGNMRKHQETPQKYEETPVLSIEQNIAVPSSMHRQHTPKYASRSSSTMSAHVCTI
jgi:hypothetical protein